MILKLCVLTLLVTFALSASKNSVVIFRSLKCTVSEKYAFKNLSCIMTHNSRNSTSLIGSIYFKEPLYEFNFEAIMMYKATTVFRELARVPPTEWCGLVKTGSTNILYYQVFKILEAGEPGLIHTCPYTEIVAKNFTFHPEHIISYLPNGDYKLFIKVTTFESESIFNASIVASFKA